MDGRKKRRGEGRGGILFRTGLLSRTSRTDLVTTKYRLGPASRLLDSPTSPCSNVSLLETASLRSHSPGGGTQQSMASLEPLGTLLWQVSHHKFQTRNSDQRLTHLFRLNSKLFRKRLAAPYSERLNSRTQEEVLKIERPSTSSKTPRREVCKSVAPPMVQSPRLIAKFQPSPFFADLNPAGQ